MLGRELYRLSLYADLVPTIPEHEPLRIYRLLRLCGMRATRAALDWIYLALRGDDAVELQHVEAVDEDMLAET